MRVLNLYSGLGGNRSRWSGVDVTAVELDDTVASFYASTYPDDTVVVGDAHEYLLSNYDKFDFIWASPPCQTHSSFRQNICVRYRGTEPKYPDMKLWQEILFLQHNCDVPWVVENVKPYYKPLIDGTMVQRHMFWSNKTIIPKEFKKDVIRRAQIPDLQKLHGISLDGYKIKEKRQKLRNCILPELGMYIFSQVLGEDK